MKIFKRIVASNLINYLSNSLIIHYISVLVSVNRWSSPCQAEETISQLNVPFYEDMSRKTFGSNNFLDITTPEILKLAYCDCE